MDLSKRIITNSKGETISVFVADHKTEDGEDINKAEAGVQKKPSKYGVGKHEQQITVNRNGKTFTQMRQVGVQDKPHPTKTKHSEVEQKPEGKRHTEHAENTPDDKLKLYLKNPKGEKHLKEIARNELSHRKQREKVKAHLDKHVKGIKKWHSKQVDFYTHGHTMPDSPQRKQLADVIRSKAKGIVVGVKHEIHELKDVGSALRKVFTGKHKEITHHEKKAMKQFATHLAMVVGSMVYSHSSGGGGHEAEAGGIAALAGMAKGLAVHYLEHSGMMRVGHALLFAKAEEEQEEGGLQHEEPDYENMSDDDLVMEVVRKIADHLQSGTVSEQDWINIGEEAAKDRTEDTYDENPYDSGEEEKVEKGGGKIRPDKFTWKKGDVKIKKNKVISNQKYLKYKKTLSV